MTQSWSIRARLTVWSAGLLIIVLVVLGAVVYTRLSAMLWFRAERSVHSHFDHVASLVDAPESAAPGRPPLAELSEPRVIEGLSGEGTLIAIDDAGGNPVSHSRALGARSFGLPSAVRAALAGRPSLQSATVPGVGAFLVYTAPLRTSGMLAGVAQVGVPLARITEPLTNLLWVLLVGGAAALAVIVIGGYFIASRGLAPIDRIASTARAIGSNGALNQRLRLTERYDEVGRLARVFDEMLERIEQVVKRERRFTADAAHELRTPLTILKGEIDVALLHDRSPEDYRAALHGLAEETDRLSRLVDALLLLARADAGAVRLTPRSVDVAELAVWATEQFATAARDKGLTLEVEGAEAEVVWGDPDRLGQLIVNLVTNAFAHTPAGGRVTIAWRRGESGTLLQVSDTGSGIAPEDLPHVFERFYRGSDYHERAGAGLGLSIAKWIVLAHRGTIDVTSEAGRGTTVTVWLPASSEASARSRFEYWALHHDDPESPAETTLS